MVPYARNRTDKIRFMKRRVTLTKGEPIMNEQNHDNQIELTDLEPSSEVKGGNTYTGATTVTAGTLSVDSRPGSGVLKSSDGGETWT